MKPKSVLNGIVLGARHRNLTFPPFHRWLHLWDLAALGEDLAQKKVNSVRRLSEYLTFLGWYDHRSKAWFSQICAGSLHIEGFGNCAPQTHLHNQTRVLTSVSSILHYFIYSIYQPPKRTIFSKKKFECVIPQLRFDSDHWQSWGPSQVLSSQSKIFLFR